MPRTITTDMKKASVLFFNACGYKEVSFLLLNNPNGLGTDCNFFSVCIVNGMLASELFLKFLISHDYTTKNKTTTVVFSGIHNINSLYKDLSLATRREIQKELLKFGCDKKRFSSFRAQIRRAEDLRSTNKGKNGDAVNWRYLIVPHKSSYTFDLDTMTKLNEVLYQISRRIINKLSNKIALPSMESFALDAFSEEIVNKRYISPFKPN